MPLAHVCMPSFPPLMVVCAPQNSFEYVCRITSQAVCLLETTVLYWRRSYICLLTSLTHRKEKGTEMKHPPPSVLFLSVWLLTSRRAEVKIFRVAGRHLARPEGVTLLTRLMPSNSKNELFLLRHFLRCSQFVVLEKGD